MDMSTYMSEQMKEALGPDNRWYCSQFYGKEITDPDILLMYYIKHGGAKGWAQKHKVKLKESIESSPVATINWGKGSAKLVDCWYSEIYTDILDNLGVDEDNFGDYLFLEALTNGGQKGAGLEVLKLAIAKAKELNAQLLIFVQSDSNQDKLLQWYLSTGMVKQTRLKNVLIPK